MNHFTNESIKSLALELLRADSESTVIAILEKQGLWENRDLWRLYGDKEGNFAQAGNQQSLPEAALVEKIVNSVDARLMAQCLLAGINPESDDAPHSVRDAVAVFFEGKRSGQNGGFLTNWTKADRTRESREITIAATGAKPTRGQRKKRMCLTIVDQGEGQSPARLPHTILSLNAKNKQRVRFVQGKFNMGGSGVLRFCGEHGLQLVISRRHPGLIDADGDSDGTVKGWAITVVRREEPSNKSGDPVHSEFTYLAPLNASARPRRGDVLSFDSETLPLMPQYDEPYVRHIEWGTAIKLYEFDTTTGQSNLLMKDGLLYALERLLPEIALPVRLHECRGYAGEKERSFETPMAGLVVRLEDGKGDNLEPGFPLSARLAVGGMNMTARIYAFKEERASTYLRDEGVIFSINGQAHGHFPKSIFSRPKAVGLQRLKDSLLVLVDCSSLTTVQRENLFMSSRDRLSKRPIRYEVEREIEILLRTNPELRALQQKRRESDVEARLSEQKPLEEVLGRVLKASPTLNTLFLAGQRLSRPFANGNGGAKGHRGGASAGNERFIGRKHPSFFKFADVDYGKLYERNCELDRRCRIKFNTDVENGYFDRPVDGGTFELEIIESDRLMSSPSFNLALEEGIAFLNLGLPPEAEIGDSIVIQASVSDPTLLESFVNVVRLNVLRKQSRPAGPPRRKEPRSGAGAGEKPSTRGIQLPRVIAVKEGDDLWTKYKFEPETGCHVISDPVVIDGAEHTEHTFYVNVDNTALKTEMKYSRQDPRLLEAKFKYGNVLLGLALLHAANDNNGGKGSNGDDADADEEGRDDAIQDRIREVSKAIAPVLIPMIDQLSGLDEDDLNEISVLAEDG